MPTYKSEFGKHRYGLARITAPNKDEANRLMNDYLEGALEAFEEDLIEVEWVGADDDYDPPKRCK